MELIAMTIAFVAGIAVGQVALIVIVLFMNGAFTKNN